MSLLATQRTDDAPGDTAPAQRCPLPTEREIETYLRERYGDIEQHGWRTQLKWRFRYFAPETWYEAVVDRLVHENTTWVDVGGGKAVFPDNKRLSRTLADRCALLVGVDPSRNIDDNPFVHERAQCFIEDFDSERRFSLATLRMVAEHVQEPGRAIDSLARLVEPGGHVVIYTPNKSAMSSVAAQLTPHRVHRLAAAFLWRAKEEDVFPTAYRMNTQRQLRELFENRGFAEVGFARLDSCSLLQRFRLAYRLELSARCTCRFLRIPYPESNLLGIFKRLPD